MPFRYDNSTNQISLLRDMIERLRAEIGRLEAELKAALAGKEGA